MASNFYGTWCDLFRFEHIINSGGYSTYQLSVEIDTAGVGVGEYGTLALSVGAQTASLVHEFTDATDYLFEVVIVKTGNAGTFAQIHSQMYNQNSNGSMYVQGCQLRALRIT